MRSYLRSGFLYESKSIGDMKMDSRILEGTRADERQMSLRFLHNRHVDFSHVNVLNAGVPADFPKDAAITSPTTSVEVGAVHSQQRYLHQEFVIRGLVQFGELDMTIQGEYPPKRFRVVDVDHLEFGLPLADVRFDTYVHRQ